MRIVGLDFSINKPAACIYDGTNYDFMSWPFELSPANLKGIYEEAGVMIFDREDVKYKGKDSSEKMRWEVSNAMYLSNEIVPAVLVGPDYRDSQIVFEGLSFASSGNMAIQLGGYKYVLMEKFYNEEIPFENMTTYAPITLKKTAGASKKGMGKKEMIDSFIKQKDNYLSKAIRKNPEIFQKRTGTWIEHLDDLVDAYWAVQTYLEKH
jgi:hypothetical protein